MFGWKSKQDPVEEERRLSGLADLRDQDVAVLFKHSPSCGVSWAAQTQVKKFTASHPEIPVYTVLVRQERELSREIATSTGIRHESPQVIIMRRGVAVADASHQDVTLDFLNAHCVGAK